MRAPVGVGIVGAGFVACHEHVPAVRAAGGEVVALADINVELARRAARELGVPRAYGSHLELIEDSSVDVVAVCTPPSSHEQIAVAAIGAGKHVYIEKPPAGSADQMRRIAAAADETGLAVYAGSHHLYRDNIALAKAIIDDGDFGDIYAVDCLKVQRRHIQRDRGECGDRGAVACGSMTHRLDVVLYLLGTPAVRYVTATTHGWLERGDDAGDGLEGEAGLAEDMVNARIELADGCTFTIRDIREGHLRELDCEHWLFGECSILGTRAGADLHPLTIYRTGVDGSLRTERPCVNNRLWPSHTRVYEYFLECVRRGKSPEMALERAVSVMDIVDAIYESARGGGAQVALNVGAPTAPQSRALEPDEDMSTTTVGS